MHDDGSQAGRPLGVPPGPLLKVDSPSLTHLLPMKVEEPLSEKLCRLYHVLEQQSGPALSVPVRSSPARRDAF